MEKHYEITEKQLAFLEDYLKRKYPSITDETRIELTDHLISDFEATTQNGNLSQYLSNELEFIRRFVGNRITLSQKNYDKEVWLIFFRFFKELKNLPITIGSFLLIFFLTHNLSNKAIWLSFFISVFGIYGYSIFASTIKPKKLRKLNDVQFLGKGFGLGIPYFMVMIPIVIDNKDIFLKYKLFFSFYWFFAFSLSVAAIIVLHKKKKIILEKYKHLLN